MCYALAIMTAAMLGFGVAFTLGWLPPIPGSPHSGDTIGLGLIGVGGAWLLALFVAHSTSEDKDEDNE